MGTSSFVSEQKILAFLQFDFPLSPENVLQLQHANSFSLKPVKLDFNQKIQQTNEGSIVLPSS